MAYEKQNFTDGQTLTAEHLNHIEDGIHEISSIQPDYNQNDPTAADHIKNRPFYIVEDVVLPEMTLTGGYDKISPEINLVLGETYSVFLDGIKYDTVCQSEFGSGYKYLTRTSGVLPSFIVYTFQVHGPKGVTIKVSQVHETKTLPEFFIPDSVRHKDAVFDNSVSMGRAQDSVVGTNSAAIGYDVEASGYASHAEGYYTAALSAWQHVQGKYNKVDSNDEFAHIVGNGSWDTESMRSNAHTLDWDGNAWFAGDVYVGSESGTNRDDGSKRLATVDEVVSAPSTASVGQVIAVKAVDEDGRPTEWEAVDSNNGLGCELLFSGGAENITSFVQEFDTKSHDNFLLVFGGKKGEATISITNADLVASGRRYKVCYYTSFLTATTTAYPYGSIAERVIRLDDETAYVSYWQDVTQDDAAMSTWNGAGNTEKVRLLYLYESTESDKLSITFSAEVSEFTVKVYGL